MWYKYTENICKNALIVQTNEKCSFFIATLWTELDKKVQGVDVGLRCKQKTKQKTKTKVGLHLVQWKRRRQKNSDGLFYRFSLGFLFEFASITRYYKKLSRCCKWCNGVSATFKLNTCRHRDSQFYFYRSNKYSQSLQLLSAAHKINLSCHKSGM